VPTSRATRVTSAAKRVELVHHRVDRVLQLENLALDVDRDLRDRSPRATAVVTSAMLRTCVVRFAASRLTLSSGPSTCRDTRHARLAAEPALVPTSRADARDFAGKRVELVGP